MSKQASVRNVVPIPMSVYADLLPKPVTTEPAQPVTSAEPAALIGPFPGWLVAKVQPPIPLSLLALPPCRACGKRKDWILDDNGTWQCHCYWSRWK